MSVVNKYILYIETPAIQLTSVGLALACPNNNNYCIYTNVGVWRKPLIEIVELNVQNKSNFQVTVMYNCVTGILNNYRT